MTPSLTLMARLHVLVGPPVTIADGAPGRRFIPIVGGTVKGDLSGRILAGGGDWQTILADGGMEIDAHYALDIEGHGHVEVRSQGVRVGPPGILAALGRGEIVDPSTYYFRTFVRLTTAAPGLARLNGILAIAVGARAPGAVDLDVVEVS